MEKTTVSECFFDNPILNVPSQRPSRHWELKDGRPTEWLVESRDLSGKLSARGAELSTEMEPTAS